MRGQVVESFDASEYLFHSSSQLYPEVDCEYSFTCGQYRLKTAGKLPVDRVVNRHGKSAVNRWFLNIVEAVAVVSPLDRQRFDRSHPLYFESSHLNETS